MEKSDIDALVTDRIREVRTIDYKEIIGNLGEERVKVELLRDVASFANTMGGVIYFGVKERRADNGRHTGEPESACGLEGFNGDEDIRRIENILATGIEPRVWIETEEVKGFEKGPVLALRVRQSWAGPHMVRDGRFYARDNTGKKPMDYHMIRNSFISFLALNEEIRSFQRDRVKAILEDRTPLRLDSDARLVIHALPVSAFNPVTRRLIPINELENRAGMVSFGSTRRGRANLDGWVVPHTSKGGTKEYVQMFRNGILERVHTGFTWDECGEQYVIGRDIIEMLVKGVRGLLDTQRSLGIQPPIIVMVAVKGVAGRKLTHSTQGFVFTGTFDRDEFVLPEMICEDFDAPNDNLIQELVNIFWQAGGSNEEAPDIKRV